MVRPERQREYSATVSRAALQRCFVSVRTWAATTSTVKSRPPCCASLGSRTSAAIRLLLCHQALDRHSIFQTRAKIDRYPSARHAWPSVGAASSPTKRRPAGQVSTLSLPPFYRRRTPEAVRVLAPTFTSQAFGSWTLSPRGSCDFFGWTWLRDRDGGPRRSGG